MFSKIIVAIVIALAIVGSVNAQSEVSTAQDTATIARFNYTNGAGYVKMVTSDNMVQFARVRCAPNYEDAYPAADTVVTLDNGSMAFDGEYGPTVCTYDTATQNPAQVGYELIINQNIDSSALYEYVSDYVGEGNATTLYITLPEGSDMLYSILTYNAVSHYYATGNTVYAPMVSGN